MIYHYVQALVHVSSINGASSYTTLVTQSAVQKCPTSYTIHHKYLYFLNSITVYHSTKYCYEFTPKEL